MQSKAAGSANSFSGLCFPGAAGERRYVLIPSDCIQYGRECRICKLDRLTSVSIGLAVSVSSNCLPFRRETSSMISPQKGVILRNKLHIQFMCVLPSWCEFYVHLLDRKNTLTHDLSFSGTGVLNCINFGLYLLLHKYHFANRGQH